jgi:hypothetical protein
MRRLEGAVQGRDPLRPWYVPCSSEAMPFARVSVAGAMAVAMVACAPPRLPEPALAPQPSSALAEVAYPPPPAHVERIPPNPGRGAVWVDGEWVWQARHWAWKAGRWVVPPAGARWSPWTSVRDRMGALYVAPGAWRDASGNEVEEPVPVASPSTGGVTAVN